MIDSADHPAAITGIWKAYNAQLKTWKDAPGLSAADCTAVSDSEDDDEDSAEDWAADINKFLRGGISLITPLSKMHTSGGLELMDGYIQNSQLPEFGAIMHAHSAWGSCTLDIRLWNKRTQQAMCLLSKTYTAGKAEFVPSRKEDEDNDWGFSDHEEKEGFETDGVCFKKVLKESYSESGDREYGGDETTTVTDMYRLCIMLQHQRIKQGQVTPTIPLVFWCLEHPIRTRCRGYDGSEEKSSDEFGTTHKRDLLKYLQGEHKWE